jgi:prephenate dehydratase
LEPASDKTSLVFSLKDECGALEKVLEAFASAEHQPQQN